MSWLRRFFGALLALVILFEEWGWDALQAAMARLGRLPLLAWLERRLAALPPYAALAVLFVPALTLLPLKLLGIWLLTRGQVVWSLVLVLAAKLVGTAVVARLFALTHPALMRLAWFASGYARWVAFKEDLLARVRATWAWRRAHAAQHRFRQAWGRWRAGKD
jgi:hypothetical protein